MDYPITHGICDACSQTVLEEVSEPLQQFIHRLEMPVLMINAETLVVTGNRLAQEILGKDLQEIEGQTGGRVIQCTHAFKPEGCGKGQHCQSCTIRRTVTETFKTGKPCIGVRAYPDIQLGAEVKTYHIQITTQKLGDFVLLRIDDLGLKNKVED